MTLKLHSLGEKALTERDILGEFANRWMYFLGVPKGPKNNPPRLRKELNKPVARINATRAWAEKMPVRANHILEVITHSERK
jgi:hypothetical protein